MDGVFFNGVMGSFYGANSFERNTEHFKPQQGGGAGGGGGAYPPGHPGSGYAPGNYNQSMGNTTMNSGQPGR